MPNYGQYCPVARAAEILADRWTPLIVREMMAGASRFTELARGLPGISRSLLAERLRHLERAGVVERREEDGGRSVGYRLTLAGQGLRPLVSELGEWGARFAFGPPRDDELDPQLLLRWVARRMNREVLPVCRAVVQWDFAGARQGRYWLVIEPADVSLCLRDHGFGPDLLVTADTAAMYEVFAGFRPLEDVIEDGLVRLEGDPELAHSFPRWMGYSPAAHVVSLHRSGAVAPSGGEQEAARSAPPR